MSSEAHLDNPGAPRLDVVVVGAGAAGLSAALAARQRGAEVTVLSAAVGASVLAGGAWDVVASEEDPFRPRATLREAISAHAQRYPHHPYARLPRVLEAMVEGHGAVFEALGGYRPLDLDGHGLLVATDLGLLRRAATAQEEVLDLSTRKGTRVGVALAYGDASAFAAASLSLQASRAEDGRTFVPLGIDWGRMGDVMRPGFVVESEALAAELIRMLTEACEDERIDALLLPPVLGLEHSVAGELSRALGRPVGEHLAPLSSAQGLRLAHRIRRALREAGCTVPERRARAVRPQADDIGVELEDGERLEASAVVMATGKHVGGGLRVREGVITEPLAGLPLHADGHAVSLPSSPIGPDPRVLYGRSIDDGGPGYRVGVGYDEELAALDLDGTPVGPGLFVAGALLDGVEPSRDGTGLGCCVATGWLAGTHAAAHAASKPG